MRARDFIKKTSVISAGSLITANELLSTPLIFTKSRTIKNTAQGELLFKPYFVQKGRGPHIYNLVWATDKNWDTFYSNISLSNDGIKISDTKGEEKFGINARWNVEGFGYTNITADNGGVFYTLPSDGKSNQFNLNYEFAKSRVARNKKRIQHLKKDGWIPSREVELLSDLSEGLYDDASKVYSDEGKCAMLAQKSLNYALWASEKMELEKAGFEILKNKFREDFYFGCDARGFYQMYQDKFLDLFSDLFNYANITFVAKADGMMSDYQPEKGLINPETREVLIKKLNERNIKCQERLLFWFHGCCIPDWLRNMKYDELLKYAEKLTTDTMKRFGNSLYAMEVVNELHDWANELQLNHEQITELARLINDVSKSVAPIVKTTINSCCLFAEYVQMNQYSSGNQATYRQRTPWQWTKDLLDAGIDIDIIELQMYYPYRDLQDSILMTERFEVFNKPMHYSEVGVSGGPTETSVKLGTVNLPEEPYLWHRPWDEETQADWLEQIYTLAYSKPYIKACNWFDLTDPHSYMQNGGLFKSEKGEPKAAYHRLKNLKEKWENP
jgi:GH35 family endo-1,4-beta-xylanase